MRITHGDPAWLELTTPDVAGAMEFYRALFGWEFSQPDHLPDGYYLATLHGREVGGITSSVDEETGEKIFETSWKTFLAVDDLAETTGRVPLAHGRILVTPTTIPGSGALSIVEGPCGALLGLWSSDTVDKFDVGGGHGQPCWFELMSTNFDSSLDFYRDVLGWDYHYIARDGTMTREPGAEAKYRYAVNGDTGAATVGIYDAVSVLDEDTGSHWRMYLAVSDMEAALAGVEKQGGAIVEGPKRSPFGTATEIADPQGARFHIVENPRA
ncbi:VOC family protein [Corynebacterium guangdongense]|uniref:Enzyme related to lactoylglutathione lyase n=1 Tax=Corynebacterium guangdongense TaxID=1783348 RepID=A0ABU2A0P9_9CORY|nr:VOC family protein [Corynebacterium guangdongense]MDR7330758.1 putative enzyme related to lactoylglutathione lyase [Corynebacterium guangdongense]WJZ16773.1 27 kDa antigen Cfp30B [Corynebacterium guangdongense]